MAIQKKKITVIKFKKLIEIEIARDKTSWLQARCAQFHSPQLPWFFS